MKTLTTIALALTLLVSTARAEPMSRQDRRAWAGILMVAGAAHLFAGAVVGLMGRFVGGIAQSEQPGGGGFGNSYDLAGVALDVAGAAMVTSGVVWFVRNQDPEHDTNDRAMHFSLAPTTHGAFAGLSFRF